MANPLGRHRRINPFVIPSVGMNKEWSQEGKKTVFRK